MVSVSNGFDNLAKDRRSSPKYSFLGDDARNRTGCARSPACCSTGRDYLRFFTTRDKEPFHVRVRLGAGLRHSGSKDAPGATRRLGNPLQLSGGPSACGILTRFSSICRVHFTITPQDLLNS